MEMIVGLVTMAVALAAVIAGVWFAVRALRRRRPAPAPVGPRTGAAALRQRLSELRERGFEIEDGGGEKITLRLPLLAAGSIAGRVSEEYRIVLRLDEAAGCARLSERRISKESGFGGAGVGSWSSWKAPTAGVGDRREAGGASAPGGSGGAFRLDAGQARRAVEEAITAAGWRIA